MRTFGRVVVTALVFAAAYYFVFWTSGAMLFTMHATWLAIVLALAAAFFAARTVWRRTDLAAPGLVGSIAKWSLITGAIGFSAGFFGPIIFAPQANQGPLLGIFFTGPLGLVVGAIGGFVHWQLRDRRPGIAAERRD